jgi:hypothetical protein
MVLTTCNLSRANTIPQSYEEYRELIRVAHRDVVDLTSAEDLFGITNFIVLYESPTNCVSNAIVFLRDKANKEEEKMIVVYSLQRLPLHEYLQFDAGLLAMANQGIISIKLANQALFPGSEWSRKLELSYQQEEVRVFLRKLLEAKVINKSNKEYIKEVLSGKAKADIEELEEAGMLPKQRR